jgi:two-component system NarL family sensor kinase
MQERMDQLDGSFTIRPSTGKKGGTVVEAHIPLSHMLPPGKGITEREDAPE